MSEKPCCKMPAHTKEQVFGGLRFQAEGADGITGEGGGGHVDVQP